MNDATHIMAALKDGDPQAASQLLPLVYDELRRLAAQKLANEAPGHTLQPTALVHEAYLRLLGSDADVKWDNRGHFFAAAAEAMRRILVDTARRKQSLKRGGGLQRQNIDQVLIAAHQPDDELIAIDEALEKLAAEHPARAELVKLRYFAGFTNAEAAQILGISVATVERHWTFARAWLYRCIKTGS